MRSERHVYIDWKSNLQRIMRREFLATDACDFALGAEEFVDEQLGLVVAADSPYLGLIDAQIYRLQQMGFVQRWLAEYMPARDRCWSGAGGMVVEIENHTVNLDDMQGCFLVLAVGVLAAVGLVWAECVWKWRVRRVERGMGEVGVGGAFRE